MTACGDDGEVSDDTVSTSEFCGAITKVQEAYAEVNPEEPTEDQVRGVKDAVADFEEVGTPEDISDDAREGFELIVESIAEIDDDASAEELDKAGEDFSGDDEKKTDAFSEYVGETCADLGSVPDVEVPEVPEISPSE